MRSFTGKSPLLRQKVCTFFHLRQSNNKDKGVLPVIFKNQGDTLFFYLIFNSFSAFSSVTAMTSSAVTPLMAAIACAT